MDLIRLLPVLVLLVITKASTSQLWTGARDLVIGSGIPNIDCELYRDVGPQQWELISQGVTGSGGGISDLISEAEFTVGSYRILLYTKPYWESRNLTSFYPYAEVIFEHGVPGSAYTIPLTVSPYGYSVYQGSSA